MSKFIKNVSIFLASLPLLLPKAQADTPILGQSLEPTEPDAVPLRPLNDDSDNPFAAHGSHSSHASHASHASHYSGSGGGDSAPTPAPYPAYVPPTPLPAPAPYTPYTPESTPSPSPAPAPAPNRPYGSPAPAPAYTSPSGATGSVTNPPRFSDGQSLAPMPALSQAEKLKLQIMRVQIRLTSLGLYSGRIDGVRNPDTIKALKQFQSVKGLPETGMMSTPTLNALGVPAG